MAETDIATRTTAGHEPAKPNAATKRLLHALLDKCEAHLKKGDFGTYWHEVSRTLDDPYAKAAGDVARGEGLRGAIGRAHFNRIHKAEKGRLPTEDEMQAIARTTAGEDLAQRRSNVETRGSAKVTSQETDEYHTRAFAKHGISPKGYSAHYLHRAAGGLWSVTLGSPTEDVDTGREAAQSVMKHLGKMDGEALIGSMGVVYHSALATADYAADQAAEAYRNFMTKVSMRFQEHPGGPDREAEPKGPGRKLVEHEHKEAKKYAFSLGRTLFKHEQDSRGQTQRMAGVPTIHYAARIEGASEADGPATAAALAARMKTKQR